ncbi:hypothetical protein ACTQ6A_04590 [Lachnospiraceae bacterium LCP25S3_G4]
MKLTEKVDVLKTISREFNQAGITWSLGASMLLYFKGITTEFDDIDIMVINEDVEQVKEIMKSLEGELQPPNPNEKYKTKTFLEYVVSGVDVDILAGFVIVNEGHTYDCSLHLNQIVEYLELDGGKIPLQSVDLWYKYYKLMGRDKKVQMIKEYKSK